MKHSTKLLLNTIASYGRIIVNIVVTLISTRLALKYLGANDFGLYNLIAGVVLMLSFLNSSLQISSQRYFSIAIGEGDKEKLDKYFNANLSIHIAISAVIGFLLLSLLYPLFNGFLNIPTGKEFVAVNIYLVMVLSAIVTIGTIPYSAIITAREDLVALSCINIIYCIGKLVAAVSLVFITNHLLVTYSILMLAAVFFKMLLEILWSRKHYEETKLRKRQLLNKSICREMLGFVGWNTLGSIAVLFRNQGIAIALNLFFGTIVNAAYGIAHHVNALVLSFAGTITTVFSPMIIQAKGAGDEKKMLYSAILSSKLSFLLSSIMALPILMFLEELLSLWLTEVPEHTIIFCKLSIYSFLIQQLYPGINRAVYASGKIKGYQISTAILLISIIPIGAWLFSMDYPPASILLVMMVSQTLVMLSTVYYAWKHCRLKATDFLAKSVVLPVLLFVSELTVFIWVGRTLQIEVTIFTIIILSSIAMLLYSASYFFLILNRNEQISMLNIINNLKRKK